MNRFHRWYCGSPLWTREITKVAGWALKDVDLGDDVLEVGPGRGHTTELLRHQVDQLTSVEIDTELAERVRSRFAGAHNVAVQVGDGTALPYATGRFSAVVCFTMLHHVPSAEVQDRLLAEAHRVLRPGGVFAGSDSTATVPFRLAHLADTMVLVDPDGFGERLTSAGFQTIDVKAGRGAFRFRARKS